MAQQNVEEFQDFGFNFDYVEHMEEMRRIEYEKREISKCIKYKYSSCLSEDCWSTILEYLSVLDFYRFSQVCCAFAEILTFDWRSLFFKKLALDYPSLFDSRSFSIQDSCSIVNLLHERLSGSGSCSGNVIVGEFMFLLFRRGFYGKGMVDYFTNFDTFYLKDNMFLRMLHKDCIENGLSDFKSIPSRLLDNKDFVMKAIKHSKGSAACYAFISDRLKQDEEIIVEAVKRYPLVSKKMPLHMFDVRIIKEICSIVLRPPKFAYFGVYNTHSRDVLYWIPTEFHIHLNREELLDYLIRVKSSHISDHTKLIFDKEIEMECLQVAYFKRKNCYTTISMIYEILVSKQIEYDYKYSKLIIIMNL